MYIEPNTIIRVINNCPLDPTYDHTLYWTRASSREDYFAGITKYTFTNQSYQRVQKGRMRIARKAEDLYDCNYLAFQNASFGNKWFYAFIKGVEYVNNVTSEIEFEIDVMQTWFFDYKLGQSFVEREHSVSDDVGDNLVPENLELGEYVSDDFDGTQMLGDKSIVVAATFDENYDDVGGTMYANIFSGLYYHVFENTAAGAIECSDFIHNAGAKSDGIVSVFLMPTCMVTEMCDMPQAYDITKAKKIANSIGGYVPKNNKLYTYPYNFLYVSNLQGNAAVFPYEYFSGSSCSFILTGDMSPSPSVVLVPTNYKGVPTNYDEKMVLSGYPQLSFNTDTFKAWLAQNATGLGINALSTATSGAAGVARASLMGGMSTAATAAGTAAVAGTMAVAGAAIGVAGILASVYQHSILPDQAKGGAGSTTACAIGIQDFCFMHKHIRPEFLRIIDNYFTMYGYATHRVKTPNRSARPEWNYTKTVGCVLDGSVPADDIVKIASIYDRGITFWKNASHIGQYYYDNSL